MKWDTDRIVGFSAMLVGVGSMFLVLYQTALFRETQSASVLPYLEIGFNEGKQGGYLTLNNAGLGPALIDKIDISYRGHEIPGDPYALLRQTEPDVVSSSSDLEFERVLPGMLIPAGRTTKMLGSTNEQTLRHWLETFEIAGVGRVLRSTAAKKGAGSPVVSQGTLGSSASLGSPAQASADSHAVIEIIYSSVYGQRWRLRSDSLVPQKL